ncbi:hypothetical protein V6N13_094480 [Hibiscus sabdariffa]
MLFEPKIVYPPAISNQPNIQEKKVWVCELPQVTTKHEKIIVAQQVPFPISHQINHGGDRNMIRYEMIRNEMRMQRPKKASMDNPTADVVAQERIVAKELGDLLRA